MFQNFIHFHIIHINIFKKCIYYFKCEIRHLTHRVIGRYSSFNKLHFCVCVCEYWCRFNLIKLWIMNYRRDVKNTAVCLSADFCQICFVFQSEFKLLILSDNHPLPVLDTCWTHVIQHLYMVLLCSMTACYHNQLEPFLEFVRVFI